MTDSVAKRSAESTAMVTATAKGRALMGGTEAMRAAGQAYLPKFAAESDQAYQARLKASWLFNGYRKTVRDMTGRVFIRPVELVDADAKLEAWADNIDMQGRDLSTFAREVFEDGLSGPGINYILVDAPRRDGTVTKAQADAANLRPFLVHLRAEDVLGWRAETIDNVTRLVQLRIYETVRTQDPKDEFTELAIEQVRVFDLINGRVWVRVYQKDAKGHWLLTGEAMPTDLSEIACIPFYANRTGFFTGAPMLDDLADINIAHWQSQSDQRNILHYARVPILFGAGVAADKITIGANAAVISDDPQAKLEWVEHTGAAIDAGRQDLKDLEFQMETFGLQLLAAKPGAQSATGEAIDAAKETSTLAMTADQLQDALEQALAWMCQIGGIDTNFTVTVNKDFGVSQMTAQDVTALLAAVNSGSLSRETFISEMARRGAIRPDINAADEYARIDGESLPPVGTA